MPAPYDLNDSSVFVIVGSGAGGGTLGTQLALKGIDTVILEAGKRHETWDFINDEWDSFAQLAWTDKRLTSGSWEITKSFPNLPAWIVKAVGGSTVHWAGASLRFQEHEFKTRTHYGEMKDANLLDWPIDLKEMEPWYAKAEDRMGVTRTNGIPGLPGNNNFKVLEAGAKKIGYKEVHTGNMAINSEPRDERSSCLQIGFCFQGCKSGAKWSTLVAEIPKGEATGKLEVRPSCQVLRIEHDDTGKVTGVVYADADGVEQRQKARVSRSPAIRSKARASSSTRIPRSIRTGSPIPPGRSVATTCATRQDRSTRSSTSRSTCIAARPWPASCATRPGTTRAAALPAATSSRRCRSACPSWRPSSIR